MKPTGRMNNPLDIVLIVRFNNGWITDYGRNRRAIGHIPNMKNVAGTAMIGRTEHMIYSLRKLQTKHHAKWFVGCWQHTAWNIIWLEGSITRDEIAEYIPNLLPF